MYAVLAPAGEIFCAFAAFATAATPTLLELNTAVTFFP